MKLTLFGYSIIHALADLSTAAVMFAAFASNGYGPDQAFSFIITYNVLAFGLQAVFGFLIDKYQVAQESACIGCVLIICSLLVFPSVVFVILFAGIGSALFHGGGGTISLSISPFRATAPGIFIAPGVLGEMAGILIGTTGRFTVWPLLILLIVSGTFIVIRKVPTFSSKTELVKKKPSYLDFLILLFMFSISARVLYGMVADYTWKADTTLLVALTVAIAAGRGLGGYVGDRFGWQKIAIIVLLFAVPLLTFFQSAPLFVILGSFFLQMTAPLAITGLFKLIGRPATAFGLSELALVLGGIPIYFTVDISLNLQLLSFTILVVSLISLLVGFHSLAYFFRNLEKSTV